MLYRTLIIIIPISLLFTLFACKDDIIIEKFCNEEPSIPLSRVKLQLTTDIVSERDVAVDGSGFISGNNFEIEKNGVRKSANITGYLCKNLVFTVDVIYNDTANTSKLRIKGDNVGGSLLYSPNTGNETGYTTIGGFNGFYSGNTGHGTFVSPLFSGEFSYTYYIQ